MQRAAAAAPRAPAIPRAPTALRAARPRAPPLRRAVARLRAPPGTVARIGAPAPMPKQLALSLDLAGRRVPGMHGSSGAHGPGATVPTPIEQGEAELFHAISVATHGPPSALSAAVVEVSTIMLLTAVAARLVGFVAERTGMKEVAASRGAHAEALVTEVISDVAAPPKAAPGDEEPAPEEAHTPPPLLHAYLTRPASSFVWATGLAASARCLLRASADALHDGAPWAVLGVPALSVVTLLWRIALVACAAWTLQLSVAAALERAAERHPRHAASYLALRDAVTRALLVAAFLAALSLLHVPLSAVMTFGGVGGIVLGIGAQEAARNALSGAFLLLTHAIHEGDVVELVGRGISGTITDITLTSTTLLSKDATCLSMPNAELAKTPLRNFSRARALAVVAEYPLPLARLADVPDAVARMEAYLASHPDVAPSVAGGVLHSSVAVGDIRNGLITLLVRAYVETPGRPRGELERVRREVLVGLGDAITRGAGIPLVAPSCGMMNAAPATMEARHRRMPGATAALLRRRRRVPHFAAPAPAEAVAATDVDRGAPPEDPPGFRWRGGELETDGDDAATARKTP